MPFPLSPQSIDAIAEVISGGSGNSPTPPIGICRTGWEIERFMAACNFPFRVNGSRVFSLTSCLIDLNNSPKANQVLPKIIEAAADLRDFINDPERHTAVVEYLNRRLSLDGFKLVQRQHGRMKLVEVGQEEALPLITLGGQLASIGFDTAKRDLDRALANSCTDPEDAVTAACSMVESVCRSILNELGEPLPRKKDVQSLYNALKKPLGLSPDRSDIPTPIAGDVRQVLSGLITVTAGIGSLRTHGGDAHGRERGSTRLVDERIARLSIHAASTLALFLIETWQRKKT